MLAGYPGRPAVQLVVDLLVLFGGALLDLEGQLPVAGVDADAVAGAE